MAVIRCPQCGRTADGVECLACGYVWGASPAAAGGAAPGAVDMGDLGNPATNLAEAAIAGHSDPFGTPAAAPAPAPARAPAPAPAAPAPRAAPAQPHRPPSPTAVPTPPTNPAYLPASSASPGPTADNGALDEPSHEDFAPPPSTTVAGRVLDALPFSPDSPPERFLRTPWAFLAAGVSSFLLVVLCGAAVILATDDPEIRRIDSGQYDDVIREILQRPSGSRTSRESLLLGHAFALKGQTDVALRHYADAGKKGGADERALEYVLLAMNHPFAKQPIAALVDWKSDLVTERLRALTEHKDRIMRHNALKVLEERGEADNDVVERVAILDVSTAPMCEDRRAGLYTLDAIGSSGEAVDAIDKMQHDFSPKQNICMRPLEIERVRKKVDAK